MLRQKLTNTTGVTYIMALIVDEVVVSVYDGLADCQISLYGDGQCHVDRGTKSHRRHRVEEIDVQLGEVRISLQYLEV